MIDADKVAEGVWIGSAPPTGPYLADAGFYGVVLCAREYQPPAHLFHGVEVTQAPFDDNPMGISDDELRRSIGAADWTARQVIQGRPMLVTCKAGLNRSGLTCALAVSMVYQKDPAEAAGMVRKARGIRALCNQTFVDYLNGFRGASCELCDNERVTTRHYEDAVVWAADCKTCGVPMVVLRRHSTKPTKEELKVAMDVARQLAKATGGKIDKKRRSIPDHWHVHVRPE